MNHNNSKKISQRWLLILSIAFLLGLPDLSVAEDQDTDTYFQIIKTRRLIDEMNDLRAQESARFDLIRMMMQEKVYLDAEEASRKFISLYPDSPYFKEVEQILETIKGQRETQKNEPEEDQASWEEVKEVIPEPKISLVNNEQIKEEVEDLGGAVVLDRRGKEVLQIRGIESQNIFGEYKEKMAHLDNEPEKDGLVIQEKLAEIPVLDKNGEVCEYYPNGAVRSKGQYVDGKKNGVFEVFDPKGHLVESKEFKNNIREGATYRYFENGIIRKKIIYTQGDIVKEETFDKEGNVVK